MCVWMCVWMWMWMCGCGNKSMFPRAVRLRTYFGTLATCNMQYAIQYGWMDGNNDTDTGTDRQTDRQMSSTPHRFTTPSLYMHVCIEISFPCFSFHSAFLLPALFALCALLFALCFCFSFVFLALLTRTTRSLPRPRMHMSTLLALRVGRSYPYIHTPPTCTS